MKNMEIDPSKKRNFKEDVKGVIHEEPSNKRTIREYIEGYISDEVPSSKRPALKRIPSID